MATKTLTTLNLLPLTPLRKSRDAQRNRNFTAGFSIDSPYWKSGVMHINDDHMTVRHCNTCKCPPVVKFPYSEQPEDAMMAVNSGS